jgi:hypothetical protein
VSFDLFKDTKVKLDTKIHAIFFRTAMRPSSSIQSFRSIEAKSSSSCSQSPRSSCSEVELKESIPKNSAKKEVTSKIASLWKRIEDSKSKSAATSKDNGNKIWISKGKPLQDGKTDSATQGKLYQPQFDKFFII